VTAHGAPGTPGGGFSYAGAGVDIDAGDRAVALMKAAVEAAGRAEVVGGIGGFAGLFDASKLASYRRPLLATSTDGVGTKVVIAQRLGRYGTIGIDLVGMVVDDLVTCGAEPLFMTDYVVFGRLNPERVATVVAGVAEGCVRAGCALIGGETAEHPGHLGPDDFDLAGAATGVVEADRLLGAHRVRPGDAVIGLASSGLHANGYSLARRVLDETGLALDAEPPELGTSVGEELLTPTAIYARDCLALAAGCDVHALAHITGGGLAANLARVLPPRTGAVLDRATWRPPPVFGLLAGRGGIDAAEMERVFNMGVGMAAVVAADDADRALRVLAARDVTGWVLGEVTGQLGEATGQGDRVHLAGAHPG
jgi:phosphoribosylformylglycinamidine cyclo-ligase